MTNEVANGLYANLLKAYTRLLDTVSAYDVAANDRISAAFSARVRTIKAA